ncbi:hypothetical protein ACFV23_30080 [Streptomyces sp. NPDC059627]
MAPGVRGVLPGDAHDGFHGGVGTTEVIIDPRTSAGRRTCPSD